MNVGKQIGERDFSKITLRALARKGLEIVSVQSVPNEKISWANPSRAYLLSNGRLLSHKQVLEQLQ